MPFKLFSDVRETSNTIGTGDLVLAGAVSGYWAFAAAGKYADTDTCHVEVRMGTDRELMKATYNSGANSLTRTQIFASTNGGAAVNWGAGAKDIFVTNIAPSDLDAAGKAGLFGVMGALFTPQGRLTTVSATPVLTSDQTAKTTIYYTPYVGNMIPIYDGAQMVMFPFAELSVALSDTTKSPAAIGASKVNDWFVWNDAGTLRLGHGPDRASDTTAGDFVRVGGILLNNTTITNGPAAQRGTYVGTTRSNASSQIDVLFGSPAAGGGQAWIGLWNAYNRINVAGQVRDNSDSWTYASGTLRAYDNSATNRVSVVAGLSEDPILVSLDTHMQGNGSVGIGVNSTSVMSGQASYSNATTSVLPVGAKFLAIAPTGFNFFSALEESFFGTSTFYGDEGTPSVTQSALSYQWRY